MTYPYPFLGQLHGDGGGWADCFDGAYGAYLEAAGKLKAGTAQLDILNQLSLATRGTPDAPNNAYTDYAQAERGLAAYGIPINLSYAYQDALNASWSICLVDGTALTLADGTKPYPASWFNYEVGPDHFILWGPAYQGAFNWIMNPLDPAAAWRQYDLDSVRRAFASAFILPALPGQPVATPVKWSALRPFGLLSAPKHGNTALATVPAAATGKTWHERKTIAGEVWQRMQWRDRYGWAPAAYVKELPAA